jgi:hypothetical protein
MSDKMKKARSRSRSPPIRSEGERLNAEDWNVLGCTSEARRRMALAPNVGPQSGVIELMTASRPDVMIEVSCSTEVAPKPRTDLLEATSTVPQQRPISEASVVMPCSDQTSQVAVVVLTEKEPQGAGVQVETVVEVREVSRISGQDAQKENPTFLEAPKATHMPTTLTGHRPSKEPLQQIHPVDTKSASKSAAAPALASMAPKEPSKPHEEQKHSTDPKAHATTLRSRSPRGPTESELTAADGTKFVLTKPLKKDPESSRYKCTRCKVEIQKKSIAKHALSTSHHKRA